jgi:hypothetical protein
LDNVVVDGKKGKSYETTSKTADKTQQLAKEKRIRDEGGKYIRGKNGEIIKTSPSKVNRVE